MNLNQQYISALNSAAWKAKRKLILRRDKGICQNCGENISLQVHHRQYHYINRLSKFKDPWDYPDYLLISLCEECHYSGHKQYNIPIKYI